MGCFMSKPAEADKEATQRNARIDRALKGDKKAMDRTIKILLLGPSIRIIPIRDYCGSV